MKRKALLMGMAVMTGLPGTVLAKGKGDRLAHHYSGWGNGSAPNIEENYGEEAYAPPGAGNFTAAAILSTIKTLLRGSHYTAPGGRQGWAEKGWTLEFMDPGLGSEAAAELRQDKGINLGLTFRYTF
ncbi:MAG TPA: hypothetical protein PLW81_11685 [Thiobacillaceae bacterium]|nr:hypothetical protein [Thiobacillaceae bacterium]